MSSRSPDPPRAEHEWFQSQLETYRIGLLTDDENARFERHLSDCERCRTLHQSYDGAEGPTRSAQRHIPVSVISRWPRAQRALQGLERQLVKAHLETCEECRTDLSRLGFAPVLIELPVAASGRTAQDQPSPSRRPPLRVTWASAWAALATAAALVLALRPAFQHSVEYGQVTPVTFLTSSRGADDNLVTVTAGQQAVLLCPPAMPSFASDQLLQVSVRGADGRVSFGSRIAAGALSARTGVLIPSSALQDGWCSLEFRSTSDSTASATLRFRVERR